MRRIFILLFFFGCSAPGSPAQEPLDLERAISIALEQNPELEVARQRIIAAQGRRIDTGRWTNPELELTVDEAPFDGGVGEAKQLAGFKQEIPFPGKKKLDREIGDMGIAISTDEFLDARLVLIREVTIAFYETLAAEQGLAIVTDIRDLARTASDTVAKRVEAGGGSAQGQLRAEIEAERASTELEDIRRERADAGQRLAALLADARYASTPLAGRLGAIPNPDLMSVGDYEKVIARHPRLAAARTALERAALNLDRERRERWPDPTLRMEAGRDRAFGEDIYGLSISLPLPIFDRRRGAIKEATAELEVARNELAAMEVLLASMLEAAVKRYGAAARQVEAYRDRILPKAAEAIKLAEQGFAEGKYALIDMLDTQRTSADARLTYERKLLEMHSTGAEIEAIINHFTQTPNQTQSMNSR